MCDPFGSAGKFFWGTKLGHAHRCFDNCAAATLDGGAHDIVFDSDGEATEFLRQAPYFATIAEGDVVVENKIDAVIDRAAF